LRSENGPNAEKKRHNYNFFAKNFADYKIVAIFAHLFGGESFAISEKAQVVKLVDTLL
jgi:hypothetical protein